MSLLEHLPQASNNSPALEGAETFSWSALKDKVALQSEVDAGFVGYSEENSLDLVVSLLAHFECQSTPVLAHPRWSAKQRERAFLISGVGKFRTPELNDIATVLFTSGSTRYPKAVAHNLSAHLESAKASAQRVPFGKGHSWLLSLPLCHVGGLSLLFRAVVGGASLAFPRNNEDLASSILRTRPTHLSVVSAQLYSLVKHAKARELFESLQCVLVGGGPVSQSLLAEAQSLGAPVRQTYGSTEMASQVCTSDVDDPSDCGRPLRGYEVELANVDGDVGEIIVRGPSLYLGYLDSGALTPAGKEMRTGDLGIIDAEGRLKVVGRKDNLFISGGENIQPESLEAIAAEVGHRLVIVDVADERWGRVPVAFYEGEKPAPQFAETSFPSYAQPIAWLPLPKSALLKVRRAELRQAAETALTRRGLSGRRPED